METNEEVGEKRTIVQWKSTGLVNKKAKLDGAGWTGGETKVTEESRKEFVYSIEKNQITSSIVVEEKKPLIIAVPSSSSAKNIEAGPLLKRSTNRDFSATNDDDRYKLEMQSLPDDPSVRSEVYEVVPVEEFGAALLRGMGWDGSSSSGKKKDEKLQVRPMRLGLGADPKSKDKIDAKGKEDKKVNKDPSSTKNGLSVGDYVVCSEVQNRRGQILQTQGVPGLSKIRIKFELTGQIADVSKSSLTLLDAGVVAREPLVFPKESEDSAASHLTQTKYFGMPNRSIDQDPLSFQSILSTKKAVVVEDVAPKKPVPTNWLSSGLKVKIISSKVGGEKLYLQKGLIVDVFSKDEASIKCLNGMFVSSAKEKYLETVLPAIGEVGKIVLGKHRGLFARLIAKDNNEQLVRVQLTDSLEQLEIGMDEICAFVGEEYEY